METELTTEVNKSTTSMMQLLLVLFFLFSSCSSPQTEDIEVKPAPDLNPGKVLIVYLSRTNNTKAIAEIIHKKVGGDLGGLGIGEPLPQRL